MTSLRREFPLLLSWASAILLLFMGEAVTSSLDNPIWFGFLFFWLFGMILFAAIAAVRHAEVLAIQLGEPYGTLVLTLAVTSIEVAMIANIMLAGDNNPSFARDTMFAVIMLVLNGLVGLALLLGGLRFNEQQYNLQGANAYLVVIIPLAGIGLVLPNFTVSSSGPTFTDFQAAFLAIIMVGLYGVFLLIQTKRHQSYFNGPAVKRSQNAAAQVPSPDHSVLIHGCFLLAYLAAVILLAEELAAPIDYSIEVLMVPVALGGFLVAVLVLTPEAISGIRAALHNNLQRSVNIFLGSVLATISLTIPAVLIIGLLAGRQVILGLPNAEIVLLFVTLLVSMTTFSSVRTNILQGAVHMLLFLAYIMLIFQP